MLTAAVAVALLAVIPAAAAVRSEHTLTLKLSAKTAKKSTGAVISTDRNFTAPAAGQKAVLVTKIVFAFPSGTKFNTAAATGCSVATLQAQGAAGCPADSVIGGGTATAITGTPFDPVRQKVQVFATETGLAAILTGVQTAVLALKVKDNKITVVLPRVCRPPGTAANDCASGDIVLKSLDIGLDAKSKGSGSKVKRLITSPAKCVGGNWRSSATYTFSNGDTEVRKSTSKCRRA
ncbi:MAG: hypothetical protein QOI64_1162 [Solirubrobacteraceae bacterium]|nr:hypothetical protein [Solirubrobacteraceae bacterium]